MTTIQLSDLRYDDSGMIAPYPPTPELAAAMADLTDDGDTFRLSGREYLRLVITPDEDASINDYEGDGRTEWTRNNGHGPVRPSDFTGKARILTRDGDSSLWWEPPTFEIIGTVWDEETLRSEEARIRDLVENGFVSVRLELVETLRDQMNGEHDVVVATASLGGVDKMYGDLIGELASEICAEVTA